VQCQKGISPYEIHATQTMGYTGPAGELKKLFPKIYALAKARVLALGYGAGWRKFIDMAAIYIDKETFNEIFLATADPKMVEDFRKYAKRYAKDTFAVWGDLTEDQINTYTNSWAIVVDFRKNNKKIVELWGALDGNLERRRNIVRRWRLDYHQVGVSTT